MEGIVGTVDEVENLFCMIEEPEALSGTMEEVESLIGMFPDKTFILTNQTSKL